MDEIKIRGARTHNLENINFDLLRNRLIMVTGLSGSGELSFTFDTLYAEGQRHYVKSLSACTRQFLQLMEKPDMDLIESLSPAISIEQKTTSHNPCLTASIAIEICDHPRLLYARVNTPYCPDHGQPLEVRSVSQMVGVALALPANTKLMILTSVVVNRKGEHVNLFEAMQVQGFMRFRIRSDSGTARKAKAKAYEVDNLPKPKKNDKHPIEVVVNCVKVSPEFKQRLAESLEAASHLIDGRMIVLEMDADKEHSFSSKSVCPTRSYSLQELGPWLFSFDNPVDACPYCDGLGQTTFFDPKRVVAFPNLLLAPDTIEDWGHRSQFYLQMLQNLAAFYDVDIDVAFEDLSAEIQGIVLHGSGKQQIPFTYINEHGKIAVREYAFERIAPNLGWHHKETGFIAVREELVKYQNNRPCPECYGTHPHREARLIKIGETDQAHGIYEISGWSLHDMLAYSLTLNIHDTKREVADKIVKEISVRLNFLNNVGFDYLSLERNADTLPGGEAQRIRLVSQIGSGLIGVIYILDGPSIDPHRRNNDQLIGTLKHLRDLGNSVLVVEHDEDMTRASDYMVDIDPGADVHGGQVIVEGTPRQVGQSPVSPTDGYLSGKRRIEMSKQRTAPDEKRWLRIINASGNNLKGVSIDIPIGLLTCVTGVSGSGELTLTSDALYRAVACRLYGSMPEPVAHDHIDGLKHFDKVINVDQSPIGRTPCSNPATYTGLSTPTRELSVGTPSTKKHGYDPGRFSFSVKSGRYEARQGDGVPKVKVHFLPDVHVPCSMCHGERYNREMLEVLHKGENITEMLETTVEQAHEFFAPVLVMRRRLQTLLDMSLGYIRLGQSVTILSGGEAQHMKLSLKLSEHDAGRTLYILDEPATGLHFHDIELLLKVIYKLHDHGNTIVIIECSPDAIETADWLLNLDPEGDAGGGQIIAKGTPEDVAENKVGFAGEYLAPLLKHK